MLEPELAYIKAVCDHATEFRYGDIDQFGNFVPSSYHLEMNYETDRIVGGYDKTTGEPLDSKLLHDMQIYQGNSMSSLYSYHKGNVIVQSPDEVEASRTCECWDSTIYVASKLAQAGLMHWEFFTLLSWDQECKSMSHAFSVCQAGADKKFYILEPAFKEIAGTYGPEPTLSGILRKSLKLYREWMPKKLATMGVFFDSPLKYRVYYFNALDPHYIGMLAYQFFPYLLEHSTPVITEF